MDAVYFDRGNTLPSESLDSVFAVFAVSTVFGKPSIPDQKRQSKWYIDQFIMKFIIGSIIS